MAATTNVRTTFLPTAESDNVLSERSIAAVREILEMAPGLPTVEEARDILDTNKLRTQAVVFGVGVPAEYGIHCKVSSQPLHCSSDMETAVWDVFIFTQQTVNGKRIWSDREVEWLMKDIRSWLLKHARPNQEALLTWLALNLVDKKRARMAGGESSKAKTDSGEREEIAVTRVFCYVFMRSDRSQSLGRRCRQVWNVRERV